MEGFAVPCAAASVVDGGAGYADAVEADKLCELWAGVAVDV